MITEQQLVAKRSKLSETLSRHADLIDSEVKVICQEKLPYTADDIRVHLQDLRRKERQLNVGIIGRVKAGKSSLINSLLFEGQDILPKAATPMTAALTSIGYGETFSATVEFIGQEDLALLRTKAREYRALIRDGVEKKLKVLKADQREFTLEAVERSVRSEMDKESSTGAAADDLCQRIEQSKMDPALLPERQEIPAANLEELRDKLHDYVGSMGKYMPFTKTLHVALPVESLKDLKVIDTPGVNDAVASREQRTYEMLKTCNVVFIVAPLGQFSSNQDLALASRLNETDGIREIYFVASQADTQLFGSAFKNQKGQLPDVIDEVCESAKRSLSGAIAGGNNQVLRAIAGQLDQRLFITSSLCHTMISQPESVWSKDEFAEHLHGRLLKKYRDYFTDPADAKRYLAQLSGCDRLQQSVTGVREQKEVILQQQESDFIAQQARAVQKGAEVLAEHFQEKAKEIARTDLADAKAQVDHLKQIRKTGERVADNLLKDQVEALVFSLGDSLRKMTEQINSRTKGELSGAEGSDTESYQVEKDGILSSIARGLGCGGYEERTDTVTTLAASDVRDALENLRDYIQEGLTRCALHELSRWRQQFTGNLIHELRKPEVVGDHYLDASALTGVCRRAVAEIREFSKPSVPKLPAELAGSARLRGYEAERCIDAARDYYSSLKKSANQYIKVLEGELAQLAYFDLGQRLFEALEKDIQNKATMVENKELSLDKLQTLVGELQALNKEPNNG